MPKAAGLEDLYIQSDEQMPNVVRTQMDVVLSQGMAVLNAEDDEVANLAQYCDGEITYFASSEEHPVSFNTAVKTDAWFSGAKIIWSWPKAHMKLKP